MNKMDALAKAIEGGDADIVEVLLALDVVRQRLAQDRILRDTLKVLARNEGHEKIAARLEDF